MLAQHRRGPRDVGAVVVEQHRIARRPSSCRAADARPPAPRRARRSADASNTSLKLLTRAQGTPASISACLEFLGRCIARIGRLDQRRAARPRWPCDWHRWRSADRSTCASSPSTCMNLLEQHVVRRADRDIAPVAGLEQLIRRGEAVPVAHRLRHLAGLEIFRRLPGRRRDRGFHQRDVGDAAFAVARGADEARRAWRRSQTARRTRRPSARPAASASCRARR